MKITDQGFTGRLSGQPTNTGAVSGTQSQAAGAYGRPSSSDSLQLSNLASLLQSASAGDSDRTARVGQIAKAVGSNTFQIDPAQISGAMVSEALHA
jgi:anti-sigma28 factor (negative regulator of flagellin synthesis)